MHIVVLGNLSFKMRIKDVHNARILYSALDWGFGHVARSIGVIRELISQNNKIMIACNDEQKMFFITYLPEVECIFLNGYNLKFSGKGNWGFDLWKQRKSFLSSIHQEYQFVESFCEENEIDFVISDHRYGFYSKVKASIFITHQLHLPIPKFYFFVQKWHEKKMNNFKTIWVLDDNKNSLAGKLSFPIHHKNTEYISWKSRFIRKIDLRIKYDYLIVLSGPSPYNIQLLDEIKTRISFEGKKVAVLYPHHLEIDKNECWDYFSSNDLKQNDLLFHQVDTLISRCGYSTLMDLKFLEINAVLIPTKGQKEQEYLYKYNQLEEN